MKILREYNLKYTFDENLQEVASCAEDMEAYVETKAEELHLIEDPTERAKILSEIGALLRILRKLDEAEKYLLEAGKIILEKNLPDATKTVQKIRLAHVYQWQKKFTLSDSMFEKIVATCQSNQALESLLDFAWQHAGKNYFDQERWLEALHAFEQALGLRKKRNAPIDQRDSTKKAIAAVKDRIAKS